LDVLEQEGAIEQVEDGNGKPRWYHAKKIPGHGTARVYTIDTRKLG
jgi:hypothetical protein